MFVTSIESQLRWGLPSDLGGCLVTTTNSCGVILWVKKGQQDVALFCIPMCVGGRRGGGGFFSPSQAHVPDSVPPGPAVHCQAVASDLSRILKSSREYRVCF